MWKIAAKDFKIFFSDRKAVLLTFLLPVCLITLFVFAFGGNKQKRGMNEMKLIVADQDQTSASEDLAKELDDLEGLKIISASWEEAISDVKNGDHYAALRITKNFSDSSRQGKPGFEFLYDEARSTETGIVEGLLYNVLFGHAGKQRVKNTIITQMKTEYNLTDSIIDKVLVNVDEMMESGFAGEENDNSDMIRRTAVKPSEAINPSLIHSVAGTAIMMLLFSVAGMGAGLLDEKEKGTLRKLLQSPLSPVSILYGKLLNAVAIGAIQLWAMLLFAAVAFGLPIADYFIPLFILIIFIALVCGSFGIFIASVSSSRKQVEGLSTLVVLVMSAIGGSMIPVFIMPEWMQKVSAVSVNHWALKGFYKIYLYDFSWDGFLFILLILSGFTVVLLSLSNIFFRKNILKVA